MGSSPSTTTSSDPWINQQPFLNYGFNEAKNVYDEISASGRPVIFAEGLDLLEQRAREGSPLVDSAKGYTQNVLDGGYMNTNPGTAYLQNTANGLYLGNSNPYLGNQFNQAAQQVTRNYADVVNPGVDSQFSSAGRYGSGLYANAKDSARTALGNSLSALANNMYGDAYGQERQNQLSAQAQISQNHQFERGLQQQAAFAAPNLANQDYQDLNVLGYVGKRRTERDAEDLYRQQIALSNYMNAIQGSYGGVQTSAGGSRAGGILGGASQGAALGNTLLPGAGTGVGAAVGGILGAFG